MPVTFQSLNPASTAHPHQSHNQNQAPKAPAPKAPAAKAPAAKAPAAKAPGGAKAAKRPLPPAKKHAKPTAKEAPASARNDVQIPKHVYRLPKTWINPILPNFRPDPAKLLGRLRHHQEEKAAEEEIIQKDRQRHFLTTKAEQAAEAAEAIVKAQEALTTRDFAKDPPPLSIYIRKVDEIDNRIRIRGNTKDGISCSVLVNDFRPYFLINLPDTWSEGDIPTFQKALARKARAIKEECKSTKARVPHGLFPVPTLKFYTGKSAFTWLPQELKAIQVFCPSIAAWRFYSELLTDGKEAAYQEEIERLFKERDAKEAAAKAAKKEASAAAKKGYIDAQQPKVQSFSFKDEAARFRNPSGASQQGDDEYGTSDSDASDQDEPSPGNRSERDGATDRSRDAAIAAEQIPAEDMPSTFKKKKCPWNGVEVSPEEDGLPPYDAEAKDYTYKFEVHNNGWKMPTIFLTLANLYSKDWMHVCDPRLVEDEAKRLTTTQIEVECTVTQLLHDSTRPDERDHSFEVTWDIECIHAKNNHTFPVATNIGDLHNCVTMKIDQPGANPPQPTTRVAFNMGTALPSLLPSIKYTCLFDDEAKQLMALHETWLRKVDPDNLPGYNSISFDAVYLLDRAATLGLDAFAELGDVKGKSCAIRQVIRQAKQFGKEIFRMTDIPGRAQFDVMRIIPKMYKLDQYTLKFVAANLNKKGEGRSAMRERLYRLATHPEEPYVDPKSFKEEEVMEPQEFPDKEGPDAEAFWRQEAEKQIYRIQNWDSLVTKDDYAKWDKEITSKIDLPPHKLRPFFLAGPRARTEIIRYCMRDTDVTHKIATDNILVQSMEAMSRLANTDVDDLLTKGEQLKVWNKYCRIAHTNKWHLNRVYLRQIMPAIRLLEKFKGGKVQEPKVGLYNTQPTATLDFNSLYPSVNVRNNVCTSALICSVRPGENPNPVNLTIARNMGCEVISVLLDTDEILYYNQSCPTILPTMNRELLAERAATRKRQKKAPYKSILWEALECDQLAKKLVNNCTFGFSGAPRGFAGCPLVAATTTAIGRNYITRTAKLAESPPFNYKLVYGDSVAGNTALILRNVTTKAIFVCRVSGLFDGDPLIRQKWHAHGPDDRGGKECLDAADFPFPLEVWADGGFTMVRRVIRHSYEMTQLLKRIVTPSGIVDVTKDHSLLSPDGSRVRPTDARIGDELLHESFCSLFSKKAPGGGAASFSGPPGGAAKWWWSTGFLLSDGWYCHNYQVVNITSRNIPLLQRAADGFPEMKPNNNVIGMMPILFLHCKDFDPLLTDTYLRSGTNRVPVSILNHPELAAVAAFWEGFVAGTGDGCKYLQTQSKVAWKFRNDKHRELATGLWLLARRLGYHPKIHVRLADTATFFRLSVYTDLRYAAFDREEVHPHRITEITDVLVGGDYVYDLETAHHHFGVGPGEMIVHNTDSIMILMKPLTLTEEEKTGNPEKDFWFTMIKHQQQAWLVAKAASALFQHPTKPHLEGVINLDMEKLYFPYLLLGAKNYAGIKCEANLPDFKEADPVKRYEKTFLDPKWEPKLDMKGMAAVRRSACPIVRLLCTDMLSALLMFRDRTLALTLLQKLLRQLVQNKIPLQMLIRTAKLAGSYAKLSKLPPHAVVAEKLHKTKSPDAPSIGSRVPFIFALNGAPDTEQSQRAEHPKTIVDKGYKIDLEYYVEKQLHNPVVTFLEWFVRNPDVLFEETRAHVYQIQRGIAEGGVQQALMNLQKQAIDSQHHFTGKWTRREWSLVAEPAVPETKEEEEFFNQWMDLRDDAMEHVQSFSPLPDVPSPPDSDDEIMEKNPFLAAFAQAPPLEKKKKPRKKKKTLLEKKGEEDEVVVIKPKRKRTKKQDEELEILPPAKYPPGHQVIMFPLLHDPDAPATVSAAAALASSIKEAGEVKKTIELDANGLPLTTDHFHRNHTALEQPTSEEVLQRLKRQAKGKNKRGFGKDAVATKVLTVTRFFGKTLKSPNKAPNKAPKAPK